ncbi:MAG TPA: YkgJ family cysteine cluster protein [Pusillimonas sp.]|uniref:YkgJ family cysteine cluster protein n=1 Tax=Pusillimonas sp. TaxID=3040095 RepID=UPI002CC7032E|nr:YkgJ family cysteine cluster protein [Pusillimonas sp.]HUH87471.1 YkgJ family cysteine cluster protein [Pusillimonas sp.]
MNDKRSRPPQAQFPILRSHTASNDAIHTNPCLSCGACCAHFRVSFYCGEIAGENGGTVPPDLVSQIGPLRACMKGTEEGGQRCVALCGEIGHEGIHCAIYEQRPSPCRDFPAWEQDGTANPDCQRVRAKFGLPALPRLAPDDDRNPGQTPPRHDVAA